MRGVFVRTEEAKKNIAAGVKKAWATNKEFRRKATLRWTDKKLREKELKRRRSPKYRKMLSDACLIRDLDPKLISWKKELYSSKAWSDKSRKSALKTWKDKKIRKARIDGMTAAHNTKEYKEAASIRTKSQWDSFPDEKKREIAEKVWKASRKRKNGLEAYFAELIKGSYLRYVGNNKVWIKGHCPDFINKSKKKIVEVFGDYWHSKPKIKEKDVKRLMDYTEAGYDTLIVWEHEVKEDPKAVRKLVFKFLAD